MLRMVIVGALWLLAGQAEAATVPAFPTFTVTIGNETFTSTSPFAYDAKQDLFSIQESLTFRHSSGSTLTLYEIGAIPDPVLLFSASATNVGSLPLSYAFAFNTPLIPSLSGPVNSHAELGVTLTDGVNDGATVQPAIPGSKLLTSFDLFSNGSPISKNVDIGTAFSIASGTGTTSFAADGALVCGQPCVTMSALLAFTLTGNDSAGFSGKVVQNPVPLPGALWLFGSGVAAVGLVARRRTKNRDVPAHSS